MKSSPFKSKPVIGLPRALGYHWFGKLWSRFFKELQFNLIISPPTSRSLMELGFRAGLPELCFPVKVFLSHVAWL
ncbi:MAG TPA: acyl-CoA dehydratase activase-related protein, partial [Thermodesulfobacteriota bacterium]|nr:acyl-CoA dehydratase activase-related protein [Thermodesulfobacteriota bacterium]